jgi:hypothetical protein
MRNVYFAAASGADISFEGVVAASFTFAEEPDHYFSLLKEPCPPASVTFVMTD